MMKRRDVIAGLAMAPAVPLFGSLVLPAFGQEEGEQDMEGDTVATSEGNLIIHPVSHASLLLGWGGHVIYVDPVGGAEAYAGLPAPTGILITHEHGDHYDVPTLEAIANGAPMITNPAVFDMLPEGLKANASALANGESGTISGIQLDAIPAYNTTPDRQQYHPEGRDNGYILTLADKLVYIAGDTEDTPEMRALSGIALAFLPMNLPYTMSAEQAADATNEFGPTIVYPYHHRGTDPQTFADLVDPPVEVRIANWYPGGGGET
jgi:L-ascorbate metabolism protein UlaG (beta-lactamase superfamily)